MSPAVIYRWRVSHPLHGSADVIGKDKLAAVIAAAKKWRVPWSSIARQCSFDKLGKSEEAPE